MTAPKTSSVHAGEDGEFTHRQILVILAGLMSAMFLASLDQTIVSTAIRTIADDLQGLDAQAWVTTAYLMTSTISTPLYGKLSDIYGRKPFFVIGIVIFVFGSLLCTLATSMYMLAVFRGIQGLGAGALMSLALAIIGDIIPPRDRAKYQGYMLAVFASSSVLGPVIGGFFASADTIFGIDGWRWIFLINVPIGAAALTLVMITLNVKNVRVDHRVDWAGAAAIVVGLVPLLLVAEQGNTWGWGSPAALGCYVVGLAGIGLFLIVEARAGDQALIPLRLFRDRTFAIVTAGGVIVGMAMFGGMMTLPLYMQIVHGADPMESGLMMLPLVAGMMGASIVSGQLISRTGRVREFPIFGTAVAAVGLFLLWTIDADTSLTLVMVYMLVLGIGLGNCMQPLTLIVQNAVSPREIGVATASATFFRQLGGTAGVAVFLSILFSRVGGSISSELEQAAADGSLARGVREGLADPVLRQDPDAYGIVRALADPTTGAGALETVTKDSSVINRLPELVAHPFEQGYALSMSEIYLVAGVLAVLASVLLAFMPQIVLRTGSAQAEAAREAAAAAAPTGTDVEAAESATTTTSSAPTDRSRSADRPN
ncbi:drug resistance transporter, EmrB/QacA subfamily [Dietzia kunjamensis subsp. schimae]|uniref:Drug resistance transporter, EmrB/QacA subfamily n=1 Tax=Dietzia kunjamensis subsp. schimae TaxID=498198 RepID=A0ABY1N533_9ACTN|nr:MDR family MFS transporter [Dietzia kunjamensis]MBB1014582.1 MFS transporter [Dietzia kunjamensis subsp. schimae]SMO87400.1 drug resistance transporter, EmrB/QacA subfamily [Dietzia kunjamensis subsp. schimae]